ncbi:MAG TPA: helix-turn-helix transcriptional regulator [Terracidiphilus sp.]|nr:helix-turn-helix transcriptional regulator [Terracidiphilus sp.]
MKIAQMHERLRMELARRIQRGTLSVSLLARQSGIGQSHVSNFLNNRRQLSLRALDRILSAQRMSAGDLLPGVTKTEPFDMEAEICPVPVVSHASAAAEPYIRGTAIHSMLYLPAPTFELARRHASSARRTWQRFVAVRISQKEAAPMDPVVSPEALVVIDRHYNSLLPYWPHRPTLYAVRQQAHLALRYLDFQAGRLVLRTHNLAFPVDVEEIDDDNSPGEYIAGRVILILNQT